MKRRNLLAAGAAAPIAWAATDDIADRLRAGGVVIAFRHALAPGTFDPPSFRLGDCSTQRNLNEEGRAQARRIGEWFKARGLQPAAVRTSPWCRCVDTATLAFGSAEPWRALGSPHGNAESTNAESLQQLRAAVAAAARQRSRFEVWVTHMFVLGDLVGTNASSGEGLLLGADSRGATQLLGRLLVG